jgi:Tfp pilus assembly protein PilN
MWEVLLDDINSRVVDGTLISNFSVSSINEPISITGTARDRNTLNQFKKSLQASTYLTAVELPITNLELKGDIPFSISFRVKDPNMLFYK